MIRAWFSLKDFPFRRNMRAADLYQSNSFQEGFKRLEYLKEHQGIMLLTGGTGTGKSTLVRYFSSTLNDNQYKSFYLPLSTVSISDFYRQLDFSINESRHQKKSDTFQSIQDGIQNWVQFRKSIPVVILDEAHLLKYEHFLELQIILNFEYDSICPILLIVLGQSELKDRFKRDSLLSFNRRITIKHDFLPLSKEEVELFLEHCLSRVGGSASIFTKEAISSIHQITAGNPAITGKLAHHAMNTACLNERKKVSEEEVYLAAREI